MNRIVLIGRNTKDIELRATTSGVEVASFTLAVNRNYKNAEGNYEADFLNCVAYKGLAKTISSYVKKGDRLAIDGRVQTRNYTNNEGNKVYVTEIIVENIDFIETKKKETIEPDKTSYTKEEIDNIPLPDDPFTEEQMTITEDNLPF